KIVMSDHGFCSVKKDIYLNYFLETKGYLRYKQDGAKSLEHIDPKATRVFCMDPGRFYINLEGREAQGCVSRSEYEALREVLKHELQELTDEEGTRVIKDVLVKDEIYSGPNFEIAPDIVINPVDGYAPKGAFGKQSLSGKGPIVGMHTYHNAMLFVEGHDLKSGGSVVDVTPTICQLLDIKAPADFDGTSLIT
ncbi:MAG TPA: nucleotide pyrophosphatase, partial [Firmicutes bacterium]|nr:nucleotide pyrophosphatase [Bacillota bacterium]